jgi:hypothetical protein
MKFNKHFNCATAAGVKLGDGLRHGDRRLFIEYINTTLTPPPERIHDPQENRTFAQTLFAAWLSLPSAQDDIFIVEYNNTTLTPHHKRIHDPQEKHIFAPAHLSLLVVPCVITSIIFIIEVSKATKYNETKHKGTKNVT